MITAGTGLDRNALQKKENPDPFWVTIIEKLFNDASVSYALDLRNRVE